MKPKKLTISSFKDVAPKRGQLFTLELIDIELNVQDICKVKVKNRADKNDKNVLNMLFY